MRPPGPAFDMRATLTAEIRAAQAALGAPQDAPAIHAGRLHLKRARAIARVGRAGAPGLAAVFDESARAVMHLLAPAREHAALAAIAQAAAHGACAEAAAALGAAADRFAFAAQTNAPPQAALDAALRDLHALAQVWPEASPRQTARGASAIIRRAKRARRAGLASADPALRHTWRRREKERLFAAEAMGPAWPRRRRRKRTARLAAALGKERDTHILIARLAGETANDAPAPHAALKRLRKLAKRARRRANALGRNLRAV